MIPELNQFGDFSFMKTAIHYVGALAVVIIGVWIATSFANPIASVTQPKA
jgi:hypothetical protein